MIFDELLQNNDLKRHDVDANRISHP